MGLFNEFEWPVACPACGEGPEFVFQAYIGLLDFETFRKGEDVYGRACLRKVVGPEPGLKGQSFWAYGLGRCPRCDANVWARIEVRQGRFDRLEVVPEPENSYVWGYL
ncbi:hypothetical protein [Corallococcus terminator]|uniref:Uncharacterized protein n=1 Tax=Corallococcus terminator TaxID=2316733 RepID=A0A3A8JFU7_9BACT|nr:hypothetical protein [Corallococcus terminator]RKG88333.1 hypothetical protein D7V88_14495 [Corallococcus terminator]